MDRLTALGTGNAAVTRCYNTCFLLDLPQGYLLCDAGGGNGILSQLEKAGVDLAQIHHLILTHAHSDHLLGAVWVVRMVAAAMNAGRYEGELTIWCDPAVQMCIRDRRRAARWTARHGPAGSCCCSPVRCRFSHPRCRPDRRPAPER